MADLQKLKGLLSRLARRPSLLITSLFAVLASASKFLDWGVRLLDWVQRVEYLQGHQTGVVAFLRWFVSPTGADVVFVIALIAFFVAVILAVNKETNISPDRTVAPVKKGPVTEQPKPRLDFEIDESESGVSAIRGGSHVSRITADINLRCEKETDSIMVVRTFHLSLHRLEADGKVTLIPYQQEAQVIWESSKGNLVPFKDDWTIDKPRSDFRHYSLTIEITPQAQKDLSPDHFLGLTMDAIGQDLVSKTIYVKDWTEDNSPISLKPFEVFPPAAQKEIKQLKGKLREYAETNAKLGRHNEKYDWLTRAAIEQHASINDWVTVQRCERGDLILDPPPNSPCKVMLSVWVTNKSVLDISLSNTLGGYIKFEGIKLLDAKAVINPVSDVSSGEPQCLTIEQRLTPSEVQTIRSAESGVRPQFFNFDKLEVNIIGGKRSPDIPAKPLKINSASALAFPINLLERGQRIRVLSEIRGMCVQLHEPLRIGTEPLPKDHIEHWVLMSIQTLERVYRPEATKRLWREITLDEPIPDTAPFQRQWIHRYIVVIGAMLASEVGEYIRQPGVPAPKLSRQELLNKMEALPPDERAKAYSAAQKLYGESLENLE